MRKPKIPPKTEEITKRFSNSDTKIYKYISDKEVNTFIKEMNRRYLHWDEILYRKTPHNINHEIAWLLIKFNRSSASKDLIISTRKGFQFKFNILDSIQEKLHEFDMNFGGTLGSTLIIPAEEKNRYLISSIMEEAIASSQLEGATTTRKVAKEMLKTARKPRNKSEKMILNNYITAKMIKEGDVKKLTPEFILKIHESITSETLDDKSDEGRFRTTDDVHVVDNASNEVVYYPPKAELIQELINDICAFVNNPPRNYFMHPIIKATILHFLIGYVHPFADGNGRTARSLFYWYLIKEGYWMTEFMSISRVIVKSPAQYGRAYLYTETDENDLTYFITYQIKTLDTAFKELKGYMSRKIADKKKLYQIIESSEGVNNRQAYILKEFHEDKNKTLTIKEVQEIFNIVYQTARHDLLELENKGFLRRKIMGKKKIIFLRSESFNDKIGKYIKD